jgi:hypothetical protein
MFNKNKLAIIFLILTLLGIQFCKKNEEEITEPLCIYLISGFTGTEQQVLAGSDGVYAIAIHLNEPMQITLTKEAISLCRGYLVVNNQLQPLPTGSTLDPVRAIFYWIPVAGFTGKYDFQFIVDLASGSTRTYRVAITLS